MMAQVQKHDRQEGVRIPGAPERLAGREDEKSRNGGQKPHDQEHHPARVGPCQMERSQQDQPCQRDPVLAVLRPEPLRRDRLHPRKLRNDRVIVPERHVGSEPGDIDQGNDKQHPPDQPDEQTRAGLWARTPGWAGFGGRFGLKHPGESSR